MTPANKVDNGNGEYLNETKNPDKEPKTTKGH